MNDFEDSTKLHLTNVRIFAYAFDFLTAAAERPLWARILLRIALGKYAFNEFVGLVRTFRDGHYYLRIGYDLKKMDYHKGHKSLDWLKYADE